MKNFVVNKWNPPKYIDIQKIEGKYCYLEKLHLDHTDDVFTALTKGSDSDWDYFSVGPFKTKQQLYDYFVKITSLQDPYFFAVVTRKLKKPVGFLSYQYILPENGSIELAYIFFSANLRNTIEATEALYLLLKYAFSLGYRRCEWRCDSYNLDSRKAAQRLGLSYEGIFRQAKIVKGRNRDTAWFSILDREWNNVEANILNWLSTNNFDETGQQKKSLSAMNKTLLWSLDPVINSIKN